MATQIPPVTPSSTVLTQKCYRVASLRFALKNDTNLRLVYAVAFPAPIHRILPRRCRWTIQPTPSWLALAIRNLKPELADNVDLLFEHYLNPFGIITAGYFYKNLTDPIISHTFNNVTTGTFGSSTCSTPTTCRVTQPVNGGSAWIQWFRGRLLATPHIPARGPSLVWESRQTTVTRLRARPLVPTLSTDHPRLVRNAPHTWNVSPTYDRGRVSIRVGALL